MTKSANLSKMHVHALFREQEMQNRSSRILYILLVVLSLAGIGLALFSLYSTGIMETLMNTA